MKQTQNCTEGEIFTPLIRFDWPVLLALLWGIVSSLAMGYI